MARRATVAFVALAAADTFLAATGRDRQRRLTKPLLMPTLMIGRDRARQRALALGWAGDMALLGAGDAAFMARLASFLASHLAWIAVLRQRAPAGQAGAGSALHRGVRRIERLPVEADGQGPHSGHRLQHRAARDVPGGAGLQIAEGGYWRCALPRLRHLAGAGEVRRRAPARAPGPGDGDVHGRPGAAGRVKRSAIIVTAHWPVIRFACQASVAIASYGVRLPGLLPRGWCSTVVSEEGKNTL